MQSRIARFDPALLERAPSWAGLAWLPKAIMVCGAGFLLAVLTALNPLAGIGLVVAIGGFVLLVRMPQLLLVLFGIALGVPYPVTLAGIPVNAADGVLVLWCACVPFILMYDPPAQWRMPPIVRAILPFLIVVVISTLLAPAPPASFKQPIRIVEWFVVLPLAFSVLKPTPGLLRLAAVLLIAVPCLFAVDGIIEFATNGNSISHLLHIPVPGPMDQSNETLRYTFDMSGRAGSTFGGPQALAMFLALTMSVAFAHVVRAPSRGVRVMAIAAVALCLAGMAVTDSRGGQVGALAMMVAIVALQMPRFGKTLAVAGVLLLGAGLLVVSVLPGWDGSIAGLVPGDRPTAVIDRLSIWQMALSVWSDHPILGVGLGNFRDHALAQGIHLLVPLGYESFHAHNTYLEILADTGIVGLLCYVLFLVVVLRTLLRHWRAQRDEGRDGRRSPEGALTLAAVGALAAYLVFASVDMLLNENTHFVLVLLLCLGLLGEAERKGAPA